MGSRLARHLDARFPAVSLTRRYNNPITREHLDLAYIGEPRAEVSAH